MLILVTIRFFASASMGCVGFCCNTPFQATKEPFGTDSITCRSVSRLPLYAFALPQVQNNLISSPMSIASVSDNIRCLVAGVGQT